VALIYSRCFRTDK